MSHLGDISHLPVGKRQINTSLENLMVLLVQHDLAISNWGIRMTF